MMDYYQPRDYELAAHMAAWGCPAKYAFASAAMPTDPRVKAAVAAVASAANWYLEQSAALCAMVEAHDVDAIRAWDTDAIAATEGEDFAEDVASALEALADLVEARRRPCECPSCACDELATTTDDGDNHVCEACADYATDEEGTTYCSRCEEYEDAGEWTGGGMHGCGTGWVSRPRVRARAKEEGQQ